MSSISIVTVAGPNDGPLIQKNVELIRKLNAGKAVEIYVIDNSRYSGGEPISVSDAWTLRDGIPLTDPAINKDSKASSQHGAALNRFFQEQVISTRYCLVLDPDFFILKDQWIDRVVLHMGKGNLAFFGAPWHPKWFTKYRYFPCVHCLFIDTEQVELKDLNFAPKLKASIASGVRSSSVGTKLKKTRLASLIAFVYLMSFLRLDIGRSKDTGSQIVEYIKNSHAELAVGLLTPYVKPGDWSNVKHLRHPIGRFFENFFPDRLSFIPHLKGYFSRESRLPENLAEDLGALVWEEFQWQGEFFGLHMRRFVNTGNYSQLKQEHLLDTLINEARDISYV